jgi:ATP adenylyltransferase
LDYIWSPWRMTYIENPNKEETCVFCTEPTRSDSPENLIVFRGQQTYVILNRYPYTSGHLMVVPYLHQPTLELLSPEIRAEMIEMVSNAIEVLKTEYNPQGFNIGINIGSAAGAGIVEHVHMHVVPRWAGDTNFMSSLGSTRVLPEELPVTWKRVKETWDKFPTRET